jgi:hypothetical protein
VSNEQYLIGSYFIAAATCIGIGLLVFVLVRHSFGEITRIVPGGRLGKILRNLLWCGIVIPAAGAFFSVSFRGCGKGDYQAIISDRPYLIAKNQAQIGACLSWVCIALLVLAIIIMLVFVCNGRAEKNNG